MSTLVNFPTSLPTVAIPENTDAALVAKTFAPVLGCLDESHFIEDAVWRDVFALTGTLRTFYTSKTIATAWNETSRKAKVGSFVLNWESAKVIRLIEGTAWIGTTFSFQTRAVPETTCSGMISLVPDGNGNWHIWVLRTILEQIQGQQNVDSLAEADTSKLANGSEDQTHFDCIVIGAGQAGLSAAGRLKALGISYVVLEKNKEVGDNWKNRYGSARLHTVREYAHLPFERTFTPDYQEYLTKDDLAHGYRGWVSRYGIKIWLETVILSGTWDPTKSLWTLKIRRAGEPESLITSSFIILAGGAGGQVPKMPNFPNRDAFEGLILHSKDYMDSSQWKGKHGVIVGTANTAHDVAEDMLEAELSSVTMIQRSKTYVIPLEHYKMIADLTYNSTMPTEVADRITITNPYAILDLVSLATLHTLIRREPERFDALEKAGFKLDRFGNVTDNLYNRLGGHYMDIGASDKISRGLIKMKGDATPTRYTADGLEFSDGSHLKADVIVFATGFEGNIKYLVEEIFGPEIAEQMGSYWTLDKEGELKGASKPGGHPAMIYHGGTLAQARYLSRFIALHIKAKLLGTPLSLYEKTP